MSIYKQHGRWIADVSVKGKRIGRLSGFKTKKDAQTWHDQLRLQYVNMPSIPDPDIKFCTLVEKYRQAKMIEGEVALSTIRRYNTDIKKLLDQFSDWKVSDMSQSVIRAYRNQLNEDITQNSTINHITDTLRTILKFSIDEQLIPPRRWTLNKLKVPKRKKSQSFKWWSNYDDVEAFLDAASSHKYYGMYVLALETGMRLGEVTGLFKKDIDFRFNKIHIRQQYVQHEKKYTPPKWGIERTVVFKSSQRLKEVLRQAVKDSKHPDLVWHSDNLTPVDQRHLSDKYMLSIINRAGVPRITFHDLRRTFACWYMILKGNSRKLQKILGHESIRTTEEWYLDFGPDDEDEPLELLEKIRSNSMRKKVVLIQGGKN